MSDAQEQPPEPPTKSSRSPAQIEALRKARELAQKKRAENAELRRKERELKQAEALERKMNIEKKYKQKFKSRATDPDPDPEEEDEDEEEEEEVIVTKKKPVKKPVKKVVYQNILQEEHDWLPEIKEKIDYLVDRKMLKEQAKQEKEQLKKKTYHNPFDHGWN